jgi:hypothetical protein
MDAQTFTPQVVNGQFEQVVTFASEKHYAIFVKATNEVGSTTSMQRNVIYDITPPMLSINRVNSPTNQAEQMISGSREAGTTVSISCDSAIVGEVIYPTATGWQATVSSLREGENIVVASSADAAGNSTTSSAKIVLATRLPVITLTATPHLLWPPNHQMVPVTIYGAIDDNGVGLQDVTLNVVDEYGVWNYAGLELGSTVLLEAWRDGGDHDGRVYAITAVVTDNAGNRAAKSTNVVVTHDKSY